MAADEGVRRLKLLGKLFFFGGCGSAIILLSSMMIAVALHTPIWVPSLLPLTFPIIAAGIVLWILGWVLEGFLTRQ
jgi:hypothetical protein